MCGCFDQPRIKITGKCFVFTAKMIEIMPLLSEVTARMNNPEAELRGIGLIEQP